jgi:hypothetical protein
LTTQSGVNPIRAFEDRFGFGLACLVNTGGDEGATAADTFSVDMGVRFRNARVRKRSDDPACRATDHSARDGTHRSRGKPTRCDDRADAGDGKEAQASQQAAGSADTSSDPGTRARTFGGIVVVLVAAVAVVAS